MIFSCSKLFARARSRAFKIHLLAMAAALFLPAVAAGETIITFQSLTTAQNGDDTLIQIAAPPDLQAGSFLAAQVTFEKGSDITFTGIPSGWVQADRQNEGTDIGQAIFWKFITSPAAEPASYQWNFSQQSEALGGILHYTGVMCSDIPFFDASGAGGDGNVLTAPGVLAEAGSRIVAFYGMKESASLSTPGGMTFRFAANDASNDYTIMTADQPIASAGPTGSRTSNASENAEWVAQMLSIRPGSCLPADPAETTISAAPDQIVADGVSTSTITVQLRDSLGIPTSTVDVPITLESTLGTLQDTSGDTDADGRFITTLTSTTSAGFATVSGTADGESFANTATVEFTAGAVDLSQTTVSADPTEIVADGVSASTVTVQLRDAFGNATGPADVAITLNTDLGSLDATSGDTDANGQFFATLTSATSTGIATISGTAGGESFANTATVEFVAGAVELSQTTVSADPDQIVADGASTSTVAVQLRDAFGNATGQADVAITLNTDLGSLDATSGDTDANGQFIATLTSATNAGIATISGTAGGEPFANTATVNFVADSAVQLAFELQPANTAGGEMFSVSVRIEDGHGNLVDAVGNEISLVLNNAGGATLSGSTMLAAAGGIAGFDDLSVDLIGVYTLTATGADLSPAESDPFEIFVGDPAAIVFGQQPATGVINHPLHWPVTVKVVDLGGNVVPTATHEIVMEIESGPAGASLTGNPSADAVGGIAAFDHLVLDMLGSYTLRASGDLLGDAVSDEFQIRVDQLFRNRFEPAEE